MNEAIKVILARKSVRTFTEKSVSAEQLELLVRAAMAAPTAANKQPWEFIVVAEQALLNSLAESLPYANMAKQAPAALVVCGNVDRALPGEEQELWVQDCSAATQNILLAAEALGLGAVWTGVYPLAQRVETVSTILSLPGNLIPLNLIPIGYPAGPTKPLDKFDPTRIHWNGWDQKKNGYLLSLRQEKHNQ